MEVLCNLTAEQAALYRAVVDDMLAKIESSDGIERRGLVLATMTRLKQVCNHPAQLLRDGSPLAGRSGKLDRLEEILDEVLAAGEKALLFTQYAEFGGMLRGHLSARFGREVLFLHGGVGKADRDAMVTRFQAPDGPPLFVLSLKAGGTGLTLTAANHVVHVDRWWNPAVEDQATDRAFRIGQRRRVQVRKFVCAGTVEEKVAAMIAEKRGLAAKVVGSGEQWITELSTGAAARAVRPGGRGGGRVTRRRTRGRFADYGPPRRVEGGLRARSTRGAIGQSWWSRRFLEVLESFALGTRLTRGRAYARAGQVLRLDVTPGVVDRRGAGFPAAAVPGPHRAGRAFPSRCGSGWRRPWPAQAFFSARLLAGDLPAELEDLFAESGAPLFPAGVDELTQRCCCPDFAVPCKHLAATFYLLAEAFDADPFRLLHWRGRNRAELLDRLRALRQGGVNSAIGTSTGPATDPDPALRQGVNQPSGTDPDPALRGANRPSGTDPDPAGGRGEDRRAAGTARVLADLPAAPVADLLDRFWLPPVPLPDRPPTLATGPELLLRQLGPPDSALGGPGLTERLRRAYRRFGTADGAAESGGTSEPSTSVTPHEPGVDQEHHGADRTGQSSGEHGRRRQ